MNLKNLMFLMNLIPVPLEPEEPLVPEEPELPDVPLEPEEPLVPDEPEEPEVPEEPELPDEPEEPLKFLMNHLFHLNLMNLSYLKST
jgi:hypothetical protein